MPSFEFHCEESFKSFGETFSDVHLWLDEFAKSEKYKMKHRRIRHHEAGIQEAKKIFGINAEFAARQHVIDDLKEEGWKEYTHFPQNEKDYIKM